jgi:tetratricopeptide (TPR) repeat protein
MKKYIILGSLFYHSVIFAQINVEKGDRYFDQNQFEAAIKCYQADVKSRNRKAAERALQKLADCYRITGEFEKAEETYKKILKKKKKDPKNYLNYGLSLKSSAKYAEAILQFQEYIKLAPEDPMGPVFLVSCDSAQNWLYETIGKEVKNLEKINTDQSEFSPFILGESQLIFSSSREGSTKALISFDGGGNVNRLDLYSIFVNNIEGETEKKNNQDILNLKEVNSPTHEGPACFSRDGNELYFTKTVKGKRDKATNQILETLQIFYTCKDSGGKWKEPVSAFDFNSLNYSIGHPSLSFDGDTIYYMSDKPGGLGKTDIYYSIKQAAGKWGLPINAGNSVNTFGYELFPFISHKGILYFSSNAHPGMGQLDIFKAQWENGKWSGVQNLKPPINSIGNDFGISFDGVHPRGFFSSDRFNGKGAEDIYSFTEDIPLHLFFTEDTLEFYDKKVFDDISYKLIDVTDSSDSALNCVAGKYHIPLNDKHNYKLVMKKSGMPYNTIFINYHKNINDDENILELKTTEKNISASGFIAYKRLKVDSENDIVVIENEISSFPFTGRRFNYDLLEPGKDYFIKTK